MTNPYLPVSGTTIESTWGESVVGRVTLTFADITEATAYYQTSPAEAGQLRYIAAPAMLQVFDGDVWRTIRQESTDYGWRDPNAAWGRLTGTSVAKPVNPDTATVFTINDTNTHDLAADGVCAAAAWNAPNGRAASINALCRIDGGSIPAGQSQSVTVALVDENGQQLVSGLDSLSAFGSPGNYSQTVNLWARYNPIAGARNVRLFVTCRYASALPLLLKYPIAIAIEDVGLAVGASPQNPAGV